jgi:hypothetical protein
MAKVKGNINTQGGYAPVQIERDKKASGEEWSWHNDSDVKTCVEYSKDLIAQARHELQRLESDESLSPAQREALEERIREGIEDMEFIRENAHELEGIEEKTRGQWTETKALRKASTRRKYNTLARAVVAAQDALHPPRIDAAGPVEIPAPESVRTGSPDVVSGAKAGAARGGTVDSIDDFDPVGFADVMAQDPEAAFEMLDGMSYKEKNQAFQQAQMFMQQIQRMMQLQSNLMKMMHDTQSTIIQNIR